MPRFLVTRTLPPLTESELKTVAGKVVGACDQLGMTWVRSHITSDGKHSFCELEAPSADTCKQHSKLAQLPYDDIVPLGVDIGPLYAR